MSAQSLQSCPTVCNHMDCSSPGSSVHVILQARILKCVATPSSKGSSSPRDWTQVSCIADGFFIVWATRKAFSVSLYICMLSHFFLLGPGAHKILLVSSKSLFPQPCVISGGSMVGLKVTSSTRAYSIPRSAAPRAPDPVAGHCLPVPP